MKVVAKFDGKQHGALKYLTVGKEYDVLENYGGIRFKIVDDSGECDWYHKDWMQPLEDSAVVATSTEWSDAHYASFSYTLTEDDKKTGSIKIDPYFVAKQWGLGKRDDSGILFHNLKTIARFGDKNSREREIVALYKQVKRLAEIEGVRLD